MFSSSIKHRPVRAFVNDVAIGAGSLRFHTPAGQIGTVSPTARHCCDVSSEQCYPGAVPRSMHRYLLHASAEYRECMKI